MNVDNPARLTPLLHAAWLGSTARLEAMVVAHLVHLS